MILKPVGVGADTFVEVIKASIAMAVISPPESTEDIEDVCQVYLQGTQFGATVVPKT